MGEVWLPDLVMPLTVEPSKPRLCTDDRFTNLWNIDKPCKLNLLPGFPRYVRKDSSHSITDDKSGYDRILCSRNSSIFFGFQWGAGFLLATRSPLVGNFLLLFITPLEPWFSIISVQMVYHARYT